MRTLALFGGLLLLSTFLVAQQPMPMGKTDNSARNYRADDGTMLSKSTSDDQLARSIQESLSNDPELNSVIVQVKHHRVTLTGYVVTNDAKHRAENVAEHTASVRSVRDKLKLGDAESAQRSSLLSAAH